MVERLLGAKRRTAFHGSGLADHLTFRPGILRSQSSLECRPQCHFSVVALHNSALRIIEHSLISEWTRAGVRHAKKRGVKFGRKKKLDPVQITKARKLIEAGERVEDVAAL
jgi:hypothetical protein